MTRVSGLLLALVLGLSSSSEAGAAPAMDWLFPAGASRGGTVEVTAGGKFDQWPARFVCNHPGVKVSPLKDKGKLSIQVAANATPGPCLIRALDDSGPGNSRPFVVGHLPGVTAREPDNEPSSALPVTIPAVVEGKLEKSGDVDCFTVELKAGQTLVASLMANHLLGSPMDAVMQVVSPTGIVLAQNNDAGSLDPEIVFRAETAGAYIVRLFAFPSAPDSSIRFAGGDSYIYRLTLTTEAFSRHAWPLSVGKAQATAHVVGWNIGGDSADGKVIAKSPSGQGLVWSDRWANWVPVVLVPGESGLWQPETMATRPLPLSISAEALGKDAAQIRVVLAKGKQYRLQARSSGLGLTMFPSIRLMDPAGKVVKTFEPKGLHEDLDTTLQAAVDGQYLLEIREAHGIAGDRRVCLVTLGEIKPDFNPMLGAETVVAEAGKPGVMTVSLNRTGGLSGPPRFRLEGLPEGMPWRAEPDKDATKPVKIILGADNNTRAFSGPVKLFASVDDIPEKQVWAGSSYPGLQVMEPWVHLPPAKPMAKEEAKPAKPMEKKK